MKTLLSIGLALAVLVGSAFAAEQQKMMTCRVTGKTMDKCCCEMKDGKFNCKLTKKTYDKCCCDMK